MHMEVRHSCSSAQHDIPRGKWKTLGKSSEFIQNCTRVHTAFSLSSLSPLEKGYGLFLDHKRSGPPSAASLGAPGGCGERAAPRCEMGFKSQKCFICQSTVAEVVATACSGAVVSFLGAEEGLLLYFMLQGACGPQLSS